MPSEQDATLIAPEQAASVTLAEMGMPSAFLVGCRRYGHAYYAELQLAARTMRLGLERGYDPVNGRHHTPEDPCVLLQPIILGAMDRASGRAEVVTEFLPMEETERPGKGVTRDERLLDILHDFLEATARDLRTGEGLCFCLDGARSHRAIMRTIERIKELT
jgi:hypothetical protein